MKRDPELLKLREEVYDKTDKPSLAVSENEAYCALKTKDEMLFKKAMENISQGDFIKFFQLVEIGQTKEVIPKEKKMDIAWSFHENKMYDAYTSKEHGIFVLDLYKLHQPEKYGLIINKMIERPNFFEVLNKAVEFYVPNNVSKDGTVFSFLSSLKLNDITAQNAARVLKYVTTYKNSCSSENKKFELISHIKQISADEVLADYKTYNVSPLALLVDNLKGKYLNTKLIKKILNEPNMQVALKDEFNNKIPSTTKSPQFYSYNTEQIFVNQNSIAEKLASRVSVLVAALDTLNEQDKNSKAYKNIIEVAKIKKRESDLKEVFENLVEFEDRNEIKNKTIGKVIKIIQKHKVNEGQMELLNQKISWLEKIAIKPKQDIKKAGIKTL